MGTTLITKDFVRLRSASCCLDQRKLNVAAKGPDDVESGHSLPSCKGAVTSMEHPEGDQRTTQALPAPCLGSRPVTLSAHDSKTSGSMSRAQSVSDAVSQPTADAVDPMPQLARQPTADAVHPRIQIAGSQPAALSASASVPEPTASVRIHEATATQTATSGPPAHNLAPPPPAVDLQLSSQSVCNISSPISSSVSCPVCRLSFSGSDRLSSLARHCGATHSSLLKLTCSSCHTTFPHHRSHTCRLPVSNQAARIIQTGPSSFLLHFPFLAAQCHLCNISLHTKSKISRLRTSVQRHLAIAHRIARPDLQWRCGFCQFVGPGPRISSHLCNFFDPPCRISASTASSNPAKRPRHAVSSSLPLAQSSVSVLSPPCQPSVFQSSPQPPAQTCLPSPLSSASTHGQLSHSHSPGAAAPLSRKRRLSPLARELYPPRSPRQKRQAGPLKGFAVGDPSPTIYGFSSPSHPASPDSSLSSRSALPSHSVDNCPVASTLPPSSSSLPGNTPYQTISVASTTAAPPPSCATISAPEPPTACTAPVSPPLTVLLPAVEPPAQVAPPSRQSSPQKVSHQASSPPPQTFWFCRSACLHSISSQDLPPELFATSSCHHAC